MRRNKEKGRPALGPYSRFKAYLIENGKRQKEVAVLLGLSPVTINQKINGPLDFSMGEVEIICDAYGIEPELFLRKKVAS